MGVVRMAEAREEGEIVGVSVNPRSLRILFDPTGSSITFDNFSAREMYNQMHDKYKTIV